LALVVTQLVNISANLINDTCALNLHHSGIYVGMTRHCCSWHIWWL